MARARAKSTAMVQQQAKHYMRYLRHHERGESFDEIARSEGVTARAIEKSVKQIELHRGLHTQQNLNSAVVQMAMGNMTLVDKTFKKLLQANDYVVRPNADGSSTMIPVEDKQTRLEALKTLGKFVESVQPKGGGVNLKVQQNNATQVVTNVKSGGFEDRLAQIRSRVDNYNLLPSAVADAREEDPDDEILDAEEDIA